MKKIAMISIVLDGPTETQEEFNKIVSQYRNIIKGRMGIPFEDEGIAVIGLTVLGTVDEINALTGKIGKIDHVNVKTAITKKEL
ncbi:MAG: TM1266 family iron-only hydrogenase system putative regulator [Lachnospirales bacterium]